MTETQLQPGTTWNTIQVCRVAASFNETGNFFGMPPFILHLRLKPMLHVVYVYYVPHVQVCALYMNTRLSCWKKKKKRKKFEDKENSSVRCNSFFKGQSCIFFSPSFLISAIDGDLN